MSTATLAKINPSQLSASERMKLRKPYTLATSFNAMQYGKVDATTKQRSEKPVSVSCKLVTETNTDDATAIQFSFMVNEYVKADNKAGITNIDGKPVKSLVEIWHNARVYKFSKSFELSVVTYTDGLFPTDGYLVDFDNVKTRADVAGLFETMIDAGQFKFVSTVVDDKGKERITQCYDPSVFLLLELLEHCNPVGNPIKSNDKGFSIESVKFSNIPQDTILDCFVNAAAKASEHIPLIDGMLLTSMKQFATEAKKALAETNKPVK